MSVGKCDRRKFRKKISYLELLGWNTTDKKGWNKKRKKRSRQLYSYQIKFVSARGVSTLSSSKAMDRACVAASEENAQQAGKKTVTRGGGPAQDEYAERY